RTTVQWPDDTALLWAMVDMAETMESSTPCGSLATWLVTLCGGSAASTKTGESRSSKPLSTWYGADGLWASFSAVQYGDLPGWPRVALSSSPGQPPPTFKRTSRIARPIVALARLPDPKQLPPPFIPISRAIGPFTTRKGAAMCVVAWTPFRLNAG